MDGQSRTLIGFFEQLKDALPLEEMGEIYYDKMENDEVLIVSKTWYFHKSKIKFQVFLKLALDANLDSAC